MLHVIVLQQVHTQVPWWVKGTGSSDWGRQAGPFHTGPIAKTPPRAPRCPGLRALDLLTRVPVSPGTEEP